MFSVTVTDRDLVGGTAPDSITGFVNGDTSRVVSSCANLQRHGDNHQAGRQLPHQGLPGYAQRGQLHVHQW